MKAAQRQDEIKQKESYASAAKYHRSIKKMHR